MYESTMDELYNLYDLVAVGGFVIIDDWAIGKKQSFSFAETIPLRMRL